MPRYYFDTRNGDLVRDDLGIDCDSFQSVLDQATTGLADFAQDAVPGATLREIAVQVRDEKDKPVMQAILRLEIKKPE